MKTVAVDLHGYPVWQAIEVAEAEIEKAFDQPEVGSITLIHGAPDVRHHAIATSTWTGRHQVGVAGAIGTRGVEPVGL